MIYLFYIFILILTYVSINCFIKIAKKNNIVSVGNSKNLHKGVVPRGAGLIFGTIYLISITILYLLGIISLNLLLPIFFGSAFCLLLGFFDDIYDLRVSYKFFSQILIISLLIIFFPIPPFFDKTVSLYILYLFLLTFFSVWMLNAFNFLDGADGHLGCVAIMHGILIIISLYMNLSFELILPIGLFLSLIIIFLMFNFPPAKVFMGDAGSLFIGINFITFNFILLNNNDLNIYLLIIIYSYFLVDTLGTLIIRIIFKKPLNIRHRSHPYQNYSRIFSPKKMLNNVLMFHLIWLLPIVVLANLYPNFQIFLVCISLLPPIVFLVKFGPIFSSE